MTKYIKVTDKSNSTKGPHVGYHDVEDDFELPIDPTGLTSFEFVDEKEAKANHPALFGIEVEAAGADPAADSNHNGIPNGVEFFMGATAANPATMPPLVNTSGVLTWTIPHNPTAAASFKFQISDDLSVSGWTNVALPDPRISILTNPTGVRITLPADAAKKFCRLLVVP